jgi:excisionase family DNA binding protein
MTERRPLFVRLPVTAADALDRAAFERRLSKQDLVAEMVTQLLDGAPGRVTVDLPDEGMTVGRHSFRAADPPEVLTLAETAALLQVGEDAVEALAAAGELPGRRVGDAWRFSRAAVLRWLGGDG